MLKAHQQAWVWQDEWVDLTMDDIRQLEFETQEYLKKRMAGDSEQNDELMNMMSEAESNATTATTTGPLQAVDLNAIDKDNENFTNNDSIMAPFDVPSKYNNKKNSISQYSIGSSNISTRRESLDEQLKRKSFQSTALHSPSKYF